MPTPTAPPSTDSAVRSMPTEDSASNKPTNISKARTVLLMTLRKDKSLPVADLSKRDSSAAEIHSVTINTAPAVSAPSIRVRTESMEPPTFQRIWSSSSSIKGRMPVTHSTTASQAIQEIVRSSTRTNGAAPNATCKTLTPKRIKAKEMQTGSKMPNKATGWSVVNKVRAANISPSKTAGNNTPSIKRLPSKIDSSCPAKALRTPQTTSQDKATEPAKAANT